MDDARKVMSADEIRRSLSAAQIRQRAATAFAVLMNAAERWRVVIDQLEAMGAGAVEVEAAAASARAQHDAILARSEALAMSLFHASAGERN